MNKRNFKNDGAPVGEGNSSSMEQVRDLLFGAQLKDMEVRMQRQEARFSREINDVNDALRNRLDSLENFMKSEVSSLLARLKDEQQERDGALKSEQRERQEALKTEQRERAEAISGLGNELKNTAEAFDRKLAKISSTLDAVERELRQLLLSESGGLNDKIEARYRDALNVLTKTASQIRNDMVYRTALAGIFTDAVVGLNNPWQPEDGSIAEMDNSVEPVSLPDAQE
jgi:ElaB/YqjD/DUF883 family membrane-anchored ribosome-binding protein